jgi:hypothetical protein
MAATGIALVFQLEAVTQGPRQNPWSSGRLLPQSYHFSLRSPCSAKGIQALLEKCTEITFEGTFDGSNFRQNNG